MINNLSKNNSILNQFVSELRNVEVQNDSMRFRRNLERIGEIMAYEISKTLTYEEKSIISPLGEAICSVPSDKIVLATILRAGIPLHQGFLNYFDMAENAFVSAYRKYRKGEEFDIHVEYISSASLQDKILILIDPMLATGSSIHLVYKALLEKGIPQQIHVASALASNEGVNYVKQKLPHNTTVWSAAIDMELTAKSYIVPGLGDAGDLAYGKKE